MEEKKFEFGKNYIVLDYKVKKLQRESAARAEFSLDPEAFVVTLNLFNADNLKINETSFDLPLETLITSVDLDYENKKLVFQVVDGTPIECDISELIDVTTNLISTTWQELKDKRDAGLLTPGQQYRITDYITTTTQLDTRSAEHQFDIIVVADDVNKLNENARAVHSDGDVPVLKGITASIETVFGEAGDVLKRVPIADGSPGTDFIYAWGTNADISDGDASNFLFTQSDTPSAGDAVWCGGEYGTVVSRVEESYFANSKLEAWQLKYCLDNDADRFAWAQNEYLRIYGRDIYIYVGKKTVALTLTGNTQVYFWRKSDSTNRGVGTLTRTIEVGVTEIHSLYTDNGVYWYEDDTTTTATLYQSEGKGVIYRMIDEFNNDCPYDFKNIQFKRKLTDGELDLDSGIDTWCYTFTGISNEYFTLIDGTVLKASEYFTDENSNLYKNNKIGIYEYKRFEEDGYDKIIQQLNNIVFIGRYHEEPYVEEGPAKSVLFSFNNVLGTQCYDITFGDNCYSNTFGDYCSSNTFVNNCAYNTFGNDCYNNTFGDGCWKNTFGNNFGNNTFGNDCYYNTFGNNCYDNSFGDNCNGNTFGNGCWNNTFGNDCQHNTFDNDCRYNTFGDSCYANTFGNYYYNNAFGNYCNGNTFGNNCYGITFGDGCGSNTIGDSCYAITFGNECSSNTFGNNCYGNTFGDYCSSITFGNDCQYLKISNTSSTQKKYISVDSGVQGASSSNQFDLYDSAILNKNYQVTFKRDAEGHYVMTWLDDYNKIEGKYKDNNLDAVWKNLPQDIDGGIWDGIDGGIW